MVKRDQHRREDSATDAPLAFTFGFPSSETFCLTESMILHQSKTNRRRYWYDTVVCSPKLPVAFQFPRIESSLNRMRKSSPNPLSMHKACTAFLREGIRGPKGRLRAHHSETLLCILSPQRIKRDTCLSKIDHIKQSYQAVGLTKHLFPSYELLRRSSEMAHMWRSHP